MIIRSEDESSDDSGLPSKFVAEYFLPGRCSQFEGGGAVRLKQSQSETWLLGLFPPANQLQLQSRTSRFVWLPT